VPCWAEEALKRPLVIDTVSGRDRSDPAFRTPSTYRPRSLLGEISTSIILSPMIANSYRGKAHGRRRMATAARPVARARRLD
jgi:hypothetical protein